jgi:lysophospholipase L1-like esterase
MKKLLFALIVLIPVLSFTHPHITWVALGDSITYLNDHTNETQNRVTKGYLSRVKEKLGYIDYVNQGHNGWSAVQIARSIEKLGIPKAGVYTVFLGTNDWWQGRRIGKWEDYIKGTADTTIYGAFRVIIHHLRQLNPAAPIVLITPMQRADFVYINDHNNRAHGSYEGKNGQTLEEVVAAIQNIGRYEHLEVVDLYHDKHLSLDHMVRYKRLRDTGTGAYRNFTYPAYISIPFHPGTDEYPYPEEAADMTYDGLHPSDKGNAYIAQKLVKVLKKI